MIRAALAALTLIGVTGAVIAQSDPIATRRNLMKQNGAATRVGGQMAKGDIPFDLAKAQDVLKSYAVAAETMPNYYPEDSKTGEGTTASPTIWENQAEFRKHFQDWDVEIKAAQASTKDLDSFRPAFGNLTKACGSCHQLYRVKS